MKPSSYQPSKAEPQAEEDMPGWSREKWRAISVWAGVWRTSSLCTTLADALFSREFAAVLLSPEMTAPSASQ